MSQSSLNSFSGILASGASFTGKKEVINGSVSIVCFLETTQNIKIEIFQSTDNITYLLSDSVDVLVATSGTKSRTQFYIKGRWGYVKITNLGSVLDTIILKTLYTLNNNDGTLSQPSYSNASNLITETLATRGVYYLTIGNWYRVATVGITTGAQWNAIGAIVAGESIPSIGRLFQCLAIGPNVGGQGTCYDVEYNTNAVVSGSVSVSNFPATQTVDGTVKITDTYGGTIATTAGNLMIGIGNIYTANPLHTIVDSGIISLSNSLNTATYNSGPILVGGYTSPSFDLNENSLFDCLLLATGVIIAGNLRLDYSVDNINWTPNNTTSALATINSTDPHFVYLGVKSGSRYIRISTGAGSTFSATTNLRIIFSSKRD
jgi:hypothetical protein